MYYVWHIKSPFEDRISYTGPSRTRGVLWVQNHPHVFYRQQFSIYRKAFGCPLQIKVLVSHLLQEYPQPIFCRQKPYCRTSIASGPYTRLLLPRLFYRFLPFKNKRPAKVLVGLLLQEYPQLFSAGNFLPNFYSKTTTHKTSFARFFLQLFKYPKGLSQNFYSQETL